MMYDKHGKRLEVGAVVMVDATSAGPPVVTIGYVGDVETPLSIDWVSGHAHVANVTAIGSGQDLCGGGTDLAFEFACPTCGAKVFARLSSGRLAHCGCCLTKIDGDKAWLEPVQREVPA